MPGIGIGISPLLNRGGGTDWSSYWATLISATVENAAPTHVVLTFPTAKTELTDADFTITGFTISSASWAGAVLTLVVTPAVLFYHRNLTITFGKTGETAVVINNVNDGATVAWHVAGDGSSIYVTKDGSDFVSVWKDLSGANHHLNQTTGTNQPKWEADGILFDGVDNFMASANYNYNQPVTQYFVFKVITYADQKALSMSGVSKFYMRTWATINTIAVSSGSYSNPLGITLNTFMIIRVVYNGASSKLQKFNEAAITGNFGANNGTNDQIGITGQYPNAKYKERIIRTSNDDAATQKAIYNYLATKYGFATI